MNIWTAVCFLFALCSHLFSYDVVCIGDALTDHSLFVSDNLLTDVGVEKGSTRLVTQEEFDLLLQSLDAPIKILSGGSSGNTAKGLGKLKAKVALITKSGDDFSGQFVRSVMKANDVDVYAQSIPDTTTARVACLISENGQRSFLFCPGSFGSLTPKDLDEAAISKSKIVHIEGYSLRTKPVLEKAIALAHKYNSLFSIDLGTYVLVRENREYIISHILDHVDILIGNTDEMASLFGSEDEIHRNLLDRSLKLPKSISIFLKGPDGCVIYHNGTLLEIPTEQVPVVDTTGAGDLFSSGFLYGHIQGWSLKESALLGNRLGGLVVSEIGSEIPNDRWMQVHREFNIETKEQLSFTK